MKSRRGIIWLRSSAWFILDIYLGYGKPLNI